MDPLIEKKRAQRCSVMKSVVRINETAKPLAFSFVPPIRRLPAHVHIVDTRFSHQPGKQRSRVTSSAGMNEVLCITEEEPSPDVGVEEGIVQGASNQRWFNNEGAPASADEASQIQGIFKAELVFLTGACGSDGDCFPGEDGADLSAKTLPLHPNPLINDKGTSARPHVVGDESQVCLFQDTEEKLDGTLQESVFQAREVLVFLIPALLEIHSGVFNMCTVLTFQPESHAAARFPNPSNDPPLPGPITSPPPPSPTPRAGTHSPPLSRSTETKKPEQQYKIKSRYKAFAAIPTNTLLLDQKAIDEAVSDLMESAAQNTSDKTQSQFLFEPGTLRKQSEELYATIEKVLEDPLPMRCTRSSLNSPQRSLDAEGRQPISPTPKSAGRETKYANLHLPSYESTENRATRPGVIRPVGVMQKRPAVPKKEVKCPNRFTQHTDEIDDTEFKELVNATTKPIQDQLPRKGTERRSRWSPTECPVRDEEDLEEEREQAIK
ncbi:uncharacterized protein mlip [Rhinoraja longicauda]